MHRHVQDTIVIMAEGNHTQPHCPACDLFLSCVALSHLHPTTALCMRSAAQKRWRLEEEEAKVGVVTAFRAYGHPLETMMPFK